MEDPTPSTSKYRRLSLRWIVPALSALILAGAIAVFGIMAYRAARVSALETASARLATVAEAFAQPVQPGPAWVRIARGIASSQSVLDLVHSRGRTATDGVRRQFSELLADTAQSLAVEVRGRDGAVLYSVTSPRADSIMAGGDVIVDQSLSRTVGSAVSPSTMLPDSLRLPRGYPDSAATSELYLRGGRVLFERAVPIRDSGRVVAHLIEVRRLVLTPTAKRQLVRLVGEHAALVIGNNDGSLWLDLNAAEAHAGPLSVAPEYTRDGRRWLSATTKLPAAPWTLSVEFPVDQVLAPTRSLGRKLSGFGILVVLLGVIVSERLSRKLTVPLTRLTVAAEKIAGGDRVTRGFELERGDEIGRLSRAFAAMADSIRESHDTLEHTIGERTGELGTALARLRETQEELLRKERLATLGQLSSSIAHELRNPLGVMTNSVYYLDTVLQDAPPKVRDHLAKLRAQVRLSESIIRGLLDATRTTTAVSSRVNVATLIVEQIARVDMPPGVRVESVVPDDLPELHVDPVQIGQVLMNLVNNAAQALEESGGVITISAREEAGRIGITVADTGPGIPPELRAIIFEPLFTTKARGIGLGLSVSRTLAQVNGGELSVDDNSPRGARFILSLPSAGASASNGSSSAPTPAARGPIFTKP